MDTHSNCRIRYGIHPAFRCRGAVSVVVASQEQELMWEVAAAVPFIVQQRLLDRVAVAVASASPAATTVCSFPRSSCLCCFYCWYSRRCCFIKAVRGILSSLLSRLKACAMTACDTSNG